MRRAVLDAEAESPFASEVDHEAASDVPGLPESWLEDEYGDVAFAESPSELSAGESPFASLASTPDVVVAETEAGGGTAFPSSRLQWPGASAEQLAFMRAVYDRHVQMSRQVGASFVADLPPGALGPIEGGHEARKDAAQAARDMLAEARVALRAAGVADKVQIGVVSAYRSASEQFGIWQGKGRTGGFPYYHRKMISEGRLRAGDLSSSAVQAMATEISGWIAAPGYSNHQDGLAIDFGTGEVGKDIRFIGKRAWFHKWLVANAARFRFHPYEREAWHWTYRGSGAPAAAPRTADRELAIPRVPLLARHRGGPPDLILRWNVPSAPDVIDVVVHLHGFWYAGMRLDRDIKPVSGLDLDPVPPATGRGRTRPTLTVLPRGNDTGVKQKDGPFNIYTFPALTAGDGLPELVRTALERFAAEVGGTPPRVGRLVLTAHSGGGKALLEILRLHGDSVSQVHVFDGLYQNPEALTNWARSRIRRDRDALTALSGQAAKEYMTARGGALRVFYRGRGLTFKNSRTLATDLGDVGGSLQAWYRVEATDYGHMQIPARYGWRLLADASADVPNAIAAPAAHRKREDEDELPSADELALAGEDEEEDERGFPEGMHAESVSAGEEDPLGEGLFEEDEFGEDTFGEDGFGEDTFGEDAFGEDGFGEDAFEKDAFGKDAFGEDAFEKDAFGEDAFEKDGFEEDTSEAADGSEAPDAYGLLDEEELFEAEEFARHAVYEEAAASRPTVLSTARLRTAWHAYACAEQKMVRLRLFGRWNTPVNPETVDAWRALEQALTGAGYEAHRAWVYNCRNIAGQQTRSLHAYGLAIDIDASEPTCNVNRPTPDRRPVRFSPATTKEGRCRDVRAGVADTSFTPEQVAAVEAIRTVDGHQVFSWGGRWRTTKDTMHFQINVTPDELARGLGTPRPAPVATSGTVATAAADGATTRQPAGFTAKTPSRKRFAALVPLLDRHRGDVPLHFLLGWIDVESNGRIDVVTTLKERGFFQIHPAESKDHHFDHERLTTDPDYSVAAGLTLVRSYVELARKRYPWIPPGSDLFWHVVKLQHAMGSGLTKAMLTTMLGRGAPPASWDAIKAFELTDAAKALHRLLRVKPGRFGHNVDAVFTRGRQIAAALGR
jgi:pentapeptide MXKDX repeat protein